MYADVPGVYGRGVVRTGAVVTMRTDVHNGAALFVGIFIAHHQPADAVSWKLISFNDENDDKKLFSYSRTKNV